MVKIIKEGHIPEPTPPWWIGETLTCENCQTVFQLEPGDNAITEGGGRLELVHATCPTCGEDAAARRKPLAAHAGLRGVW